jgi:hypothetical protein
MGLHPSPSCSFYRGFVLCNGGEQTENVAEVEKAKGEQQERIHMRKEQEN